MPGHPVGQGGRGPGCRGGVVRGVRVVYGWGSAGDSARYSPAITEVAEQGDLGSTLAVHSFLGFLGGVIGPIIVGGILDVAPESIGWGLGFSFVGVLAIMAILGLMRLGDAGRRWILGSEESGGGGGRY